MAKITSNYHRSIAPNSAMKPITLKIIPADIEGAIRANKMCCVIARAAARQVKALHIQAGLRRLSIIKSHGRRFIYSMSVKGKQALLEFDNSKGPKTFKETKLVLHPVSQRILDNDRQSAKRLHAKKVALKALKPLAPAKPKKKSRKGKKSEHRRVVNYHADVRAMVPEIL